MKLKNKMRKEKRPGRIPIPCKQGEAYPIQKFQILEKAICACQ